MTETLVLVFDDAELELVGLAERLSVLGEIRWDSAVLSVRQGDECCHLVRIVDLEADGIFEDWPSELIPQVSAAVFSLDYRSPGLAVDMVHLLASGQALKVDTNRGHIVAGTQLRVAMLQQP